jgi:hypothetical protein
LHNNQTKGETMDNNNLPAVGGLTDLVRRGLEQLCERIERANNEPIIVSDGAAIAIRQLLAIERETLATRPSVDLSGLTRYSERIDHMKTFAWMEATAEGEYVKFADVQSLLSTLPAHQAVAAEGVKVPDGFVLVPVKPTPEMDAAGEDSIESRGHCDCGNPNGAGASSVYAAMLAAAPVPPVSAAQPPNLADSEQYRMQMVGIGMAALGYWKEGDSIHPDYDTVALRDVAKLYAKYAELHAAHLARQAQAAPVVWTNERVTELSKSIAEDVAKNAGTVPQLTFPHIYLGLSEALLAAPAQGSAPQADELRAFLLNHIRSFNHEGRQLERMTLGHNDVWVLRQLLAAPVAQEAEQMGGAQGGA